MRKEFWPEAVSATPEQDLEIALNAFAVEDGRLCDYESADLIMGFSQYFGIEPGSWLYANFTNGRVNELQFGTSGSMTWFGCDFRAQTAQPYKHTQLSDPNHFVKTKVIINEVAVDHVQSIIEEYTLQLLYAGDAENLSIVDTTPVSTESKSKISNALIRLAIRAQSITQHY